jgi:CheY-like chemotaxis protein
MMPGHTPKRILIADDAASARDLVCSILRPSGYEVVEAKDGEEAIAYATRLQPDVVILDLQMPKMDGCAVASKLRDMQAFKKTPILALSAWLSQMDNEALIKAGFSKCLSKPISPSKLRSMISELFAPA